LDDDDYFHEDRVKLFIDNWNDKYSMLCSGYTIIAPNNKIVVNRKGVKISLNDILGRNIVGNQIFTRTIKMKNLLFREDLKSGQDYDTWIRFINKYGAGWRIPYCTIFIDKTNTVRISNIGNKYAGYRDVFERYKHLMSPSQRASHELSINMMTDKVQLTHLFTTRGLANKIRIFKYLIFYKIFQMKHLYE